MIVQLLFCLFAFQIPAIEFSQNWRSTERTFNATANIAGDFSNAVTLSARNSRSLGSVLGSATDVVDNFRLIRNARRNGELAESIRTVNHNFPKAGFNQNCVNCVIATENRFRGIKDLAAVPTKGPLPISRITDEFGGTFQRVNGPIHVGSILSKSGDGARGIVFGADNARGFGHVFNVRVDKGVVRFLDGQNGQLGVKNFEHFTDFRFLLTAPGS